VYTHKHKGFIHVNDKGLSGHSKKICKVRFNTDKLLASYSVLEVLMILGTLNTILCNVM